MEAPEQVAAAMKKAGLVWLAWPGQQRHLPAWFVTVDDGYVVLAGGTGSDEQPLPGLAEASVADVVVPAKPANTLLLRWEARVRRLDPGTDEWIAAAAVMRTDRLNAADLGHQLDRWRTDADLLVLEPTGRVHDAADDLPRRAAAVPPATPATTRTRLPRVLHRRSKRRPPLS